MIDRATARDLLGVMEDPGLQNEIAQLRARGVLLDINAEPGEIAWRYLWPRVLRNATGAQAGLEALAHELAAQVDEYAPGRRLAQLWETIAKLEEPGDRASALANASVAYELSGYQAAAVCLARALTRSLATDVPTFEALAAVFLQRQFLLLKAKGGPVLLEPALDLPIGDLWNAATDAMAVKGLLSAAEFFLSGSENGLETAERLLAGAQDGYARSGAVRSALLSRSLRSALGVMAQRSTWRRLHGLLPDSAIWDRYLRLLGRGLERDVLRSTSISELWPSQLHALENGLLDRSPAKIVRMPTSAGKTRIAEIAIVHALATQPGALCVYVAPYRALAGEVETILSALLADLGFSVSALAGSYETDSSELAIAGTADVLVVTPEKLDLLDRLTPGVLDRVALVLLDESHVVGDLSRGPKFELLVTRLRRRLPECTFMSLSAVVSEQTLAEFASWLGGSAQDISSSRWRPTLLRIARFEWAGQRGVVRFAASDDTRALEGFVPGIIAIREIEYVHPQTQRRRRERFPDPGNKAQVAAALALQASESGQVLIFCAQPSYADAAANALVHRLDVGLFAGESPRPRFVVGETRSLQLAREWLGPEHATTRALEAGIAVHHGSIPDVLREAIEHDFRERRYPVLVATNTLAQGVNLPVRTVVVHSVRRYDAERELSVRLPSRDYWNVAGRAGRAREETEGTIVHIIASTTDRTDYAYYLDHRTEVEPLQSALLQYLRDLATNRLTEDALADRLDPEVLALLVEEGVQSAEEIDDALAVLTSSLTWVQAAASGADTLPLARALHRSATQILTTVAEPALRRLYSSTGLSSASCRTLSERITEFGRSHTSRRDRSRRRR